jgi:hypothetical protein
MEDIELGCEHTITHGDNHKMERRMLRIDRITMILVVCLLFSASAFAATYYICDTSSSCNSASSGWSTGSDSNACTSKSAPCKTIKAGINKLTRGDVLIIGDGIYTGGSNMIAHSSDPTGDYDLSAKSGLSDATPTTFKCENYLGCIIDGGNTLSPVRVTIDYARFENLHTRNGVFLMNFDHSNHVKVINCATEEAISSHISFTNGASYNLAEGCISWGRGTYYNFVGSRDAPSQYNIFRRNVVRRDAHYAQDGGNNYACFVTYTPSANNYFQNDICIDSEYHQGSGQATPLYSQSSFYTANGGTNFDVYGGVSINNYNSVSALFESGASYSIRNSVFIENPTSESGIGNYGSGTITNTVVKNMLAGGDWGGGIAQVDGTLIAKNNILWNNRYGIVNSNSGHTYNIFYGNSEDYRYSTAGTGERTTTNPATSGYLYPLRIEAGSILATACENAGLCGPSILYQMGRSETLYGDTGWDELLDGQSGRPLVKLWPWPHETEIKRLMQTYNLHGANGARGFCADGIARYGGSITLTSYIWEFLGTTCPADICTTGQSGSTSGGVNWIDPLNYTKPLFVPLKVPDEVNCPNKYYIDLSAGSNSNNCMSTTTACKDFAGLMGKNYAGVRGGPAYVYLRGNGGMYISEGYFYGSPGKEIVVKPWSGETKVVTMTACGYSYCANLIGSYYDAPTSGANVHHIIIDGGPNMLFDFVGSGSDQNNAYNLKLNANHLTLARSRVRCGAGMGPAMGTGNGKRIYTDNVTIVNVEVYDCLANPTPNSNDGIYSGGSTGCNDGDTGFTNVSVINSIFRDIAYRGIQFEPRDYSDTIVIEGNALHNIGKKGCGDNSWGCSPAITLADSCGGTLTNNYVRNNIMWDIGSSAITQYATVSSFYYHNTIFDYGKGSPQDRTTQGIVGYSNNGKGTIRDNIIYSPMGNAAFDSSPFTKSNNVCSGSGCIAYLSSTFLSTDQNNPAFLQIGSASNAKDAGISVAVTKDYRGIPRPQGSGYDVGAFEYVSGIASCGDGSCSASETCTSCPADCGQCPIQCLPAEIAPCNGCIDAAELSAYIAQWKSTSAITMKQLIDAIAQWKGGC